MIKQNLLLIYKRKKKLTLLLETIVFVSNLHLIEIKLNRVQYQ
jgi:hypothetical protein